MKKLFIFSLITSSIITLMACKDKDSTSDLKQAKTTREAIQAISGVEYKLVKVLPEIRKVQVTDTSFIKFVDLGSPDVNESENAIVGGKIAILGMISNVKGLKNGDINRPFKYIDEYFNLDSQNKIHFAYSIPYLKIENDTLKFYDEDNPLHVTIYSFVSNSPKNN